MRRRTVLRVPEPTNSLAGTLEYGITATLVLVVIVALLEICGVYIGVRG